MGRVHDIDSGYYDPPEEEQIPLDGYYGHPEEEEVMSKDGLKPCPFCGGEPERKHGYWIECKECGAGVSAPKTDISAHAVVARWNTRKE